MFWGLIMEPGKKYSQTVEKSFHVSQAALDLDTAQSECVQVLLGFESRNYLLCTLQKGKWVQSQLDLNFQAGDTVSFATNGPGHVHLTGYLVPEDDFEYMDEEEEEEEEEVPSLVEVSMKKRKASEIMKKEQGKPGKKSKTELLLEEYGRADTDDSDDSDVNTDALEEEEDDDSDVADEEDEFSEDDMDEDDDDAESEEEEVQVQKAAKSPKQKSPKAAASPKQKSPKAAAAASPKQNGVAKTPKSEKKKQQAAENKTPKQEKQVQKSPKSEKGSKTAASASSPAKKAEGGIIIEELKVGDGQQAKSGKYATVYYEGRLKANNKMFDSSTKGPGFRFRLGKQEVIKGWDIGVSGMKVGGKRRITCPPHMAYGAQGSPPVIPPNSTLVFEVELKKLN